MLKGLYFIKKFSRLFVFLIIFLFLAWLLSRGKVYEKNELIYGITFSPKQASSLDLDWQDLFIKILDELKVNNLRLVAYWNEVEKENNKYDWNDLDWEVAEAAKRDAKVILAVGGRLPRWPECHYPNWTESLNKKQKQTENLEYIAETIKRYRGNDNIIAWQIENEPFLSHFGECPELDKNFLDQEIALAESLDQRPIVVTDSGELSFWIPAARRGDIFGTTMYRDTYSKVLHSYVHYPIGPGFFRFKKNITNLFADPQKWMVIELQAEPWGPKQFQDLSQTERDKTMNLEKFKDILEFSRQAGFKEFYLWGVEWWYWEKIKNNNPAIWEEAKKIF